MKRCMALALGLLLMAGMCVPALAAPVWRDETKPFDLKAVSWGPMISDHATRRYFAENANGRFSVWQGDPPNAWLRLDSGEPMGALETLSDFRVASGRAVCGGMPVPLPDMDPDSMEWRTLHFVPHKGFSRAALDIRLEEGEKIDNLTIACTRKRLDGGEETITLPLSGVPLDMGYPQGGAAFTAIRFSPFAWQAEDKSFFEGYSTAPATLGNMLAYYAYMPMDQAPEELLSQPVEATEGKLYLLEGTISKKKGDFGVYDVVFALKNPPEGIWLAPYQACGNCTEIDAFDLGADLLTPEEPRERNFAILLLVRPGGRSDAEIDKLIKTLDITATFSGEKWDISYEQHGTTSGIGPRSSEKVHMEQMKKGEGVLHRLD
ncbi:MAG: hypothetical protein ACOX6O_06220 [Christensenellales bacterium]|jgi:hypothetical protein